MKRYVVANWKSNKTVAGAAAWFVEFGTSPHLHDFEIIIAPAFPLLLPVGQELAKTTLSASLAAQDTSPFPLGSYTGAVAAQQLLDLGVRYCLVGHSERREYFHETDADIAKKITELLSLDLTPILCLDEPYIESQARWLSNEQRQAVLVAYEPRSVIGLGQPVSVEQVKRVIGMVKQYFPSAPILYGGSIDERNCSEFLLVTNGVLVGSASLEGKRFAQIVAACAGH